MGFAIFESNVEEFEEDGRNYKIIFKTTVSHQLKADFKQAIKTVCKTKVAEKFSRITFILENAGYNNPATAWIKTEEYKKGLKIVHINTFHLSINHRQETTATFVTETARILAHEISHLLQEAIVKALTQKEIIQERPKTSLDKNMKKISGNQDLIPHMRLVREYLRSFVDYIHIEGFAEFSAGQSVNKYSYNPEYSQSLYKQAKNKMIEVEDLRKAHLIKFGQVSRPKKYKNMDDYLKAAVEMKGLLKLLIKKIKENSYGIGEYMYYQIEFQSKTEINFIKIKPFKLIKKYEEAELISGRKPIISFKSKNGYFDYNLSLAEWAATKKVKK
jgi:hypothetical protein